MGSSSIFHRSARSAPPCRRWATAIRLWSRQSRCKARALDYAPAGSFTSQPAEAIGAALLPRKASL